MPVGATRRRIVTILFGLLSAFSYGYADFVGAIASKKVRPLTVTTIAFIFGLFLALLFSIPMGASFEPNVIQIGIFAGICSAAAITFLYAALALGPISITSPLTAVLSALVPVVIDISNGQQLSELSLLALVLILVAVVLVAFVPGNDVRLPSLRATLYSVGAGFGFAGIFIFLDMAPAGSGLGVLIVMRVVGITIPLHNINRVRMENLFHKIFSSAQIDITIDDRFGNPVKPREWFLVPLHVIDQAVQHIMDGTITEVIYDTSKAELVRG